jgi:hypothetical protein
MKLPVHNHSGYKGVSRSRNRWESYITFNNKKKHIGQFDTKEEAALAYNNMALELFGEYARFNIIDVSTKATA